MHPCPDHHCFFLFVFLSQAWQVRCEMREISSFMPLYALLIYYDDNNKYYEWRRLTQERECVVNKTSSPHVMAASRYTRYTTHVIIYTYTYVCAKSLILTFFLFAFLLFFFIFFLWSLLSDQPFRGTLVRSTVVRSTARSANHHGLWAPSANEWSLGVADGHTSYEGYNS